MAGWSDAIKFTNFDTYSEIGKHAVALQKSSTTMHVLYSDVQSCLAYSDLTGTPRAASFDTVNGRLVVLTSVPAIYVFDFATWTLTDTWNTGTIPALQSLNFDNDFNIGANLIPVIDKENAFVDVFNLTDTTITKYNFANSSGRTANVTWVNGYGSTGQLQAAYLDETNKRLWLAWFNGSGTPQTQVGYLDLTETGGAYTFTVVYKVAESGYNSLTELLVSQEQDTIILSIGGYIAGGNYSRVRTINISSGALVKDYTFSLFSNMTKSNVTHLCYSEGCIYGQFGYYASQADYRGLLKIDTSNDSITYHRPSFATLDDYNIKDIVNGPAGQLFVLHNGGTQATNYASLYDITSDSWMLYDNTAVPGIYPPFGAGYYVMAYDSVDNYAAAIGNGYYVVFPEDGVLSRADYYTGVLSGGTWTFTSQGALVQNRNEYDAVGVVDPNNSSSMYAFWQTKDGDIKWGKDGTELNLSAYLLAGEDVPIERAITGDPHKLSFSCSHGYLFDPHNIYSTLRNTFGKGRKLTVRWGEKISGTDYWQNAGTFYVTDRKLKYEKGVYTDIKINAEDMRSLWSNCHIYATDYYNNYPEVIIADLIETHTDLTSSDIDLPVFDNRVVIEHQWIDVTLDEVLTQICDRFGYYLKVTVDNKISAGKISDSNTVDHTYSDTTKLLTFEPDDKYSDFTNRVTVTGQEKTYLSVTYPEERVGTLAGTIGWWGCKNTYDIHYSVDDSRTCINPRLVVLESATSLGFKLGSLSPGTGFNGDVSESITFIDPNNKYCTITVAAPNLIPDAIAWAGSLVGSYFMPDLVASLGAGATKRLGSAWSAMSTMGFLAVLSAVANFQYEIWATPCGRVRRSVQSRYPYGNDINFQQEIGVVVDKKIEDPLCYSESECNFVADNEMMVARLQRNRVKLSKIAHLQDEEGDTIQIKHPYTGADLQLFATNLKRTYKKPTSADGDGGFYDEIEAWVI